MITNKKSDRSPISAAEVIAAAEKLKQQNPNLRVKNPFVVGINFEDGEKIKKLLGFDYREWHDDGRGHNRGESDGLYFVMVFETDKGTNKSLSLTSILKEKDGMAQGEKEFKHHRNEGGLAAVMRGFDEVTTDALAAITKFFENERTVKIKWLQKENYSVSMINIE
jgi:hypothetical protein